MCLAVLGKIIEITDTEPNSLWKMRRVSFGGIIKEVSLAYVPSAQAGDYVIVHVGFALSILALVNCNAAPAISYSRYEIDPFLKKLIAIGYWLLAIGYEQ